MGESFAGYLSRKPQQAGGRAPRTTPPSILPTAQERLLDLHRKVGNQAVTRMLRPSQVPASARPDDESQHFRPPEAAAWAASVILAATADESEARRLARQVPRELPTNLASSHSRGPTVPNEAPNAFLRQMSTRFGHDFSHVRIHTDSAADAAASAVRASAFTFGEDVFFRAGRYEPGTPEGRHLIAHEFAHVVQQRLSGSRVQCHPDETSEEEEEEERSRREQERQATQRRRTGTSGSRAAGRRCCRR